MTTTRPDLLGGSWLSRDLPVTPSPAAPGADRAVLVHRASSAPGGSPRARAVLSLHGPGDYFFQTHVAQALEEAGHDFYALDLRGCGRSAAGACPRGAHGVQDLRVHAEEVALALRVVREEHGHRTVVLHGHSTAALVAAVWAADHPGAVDALVLSSPWLDLNDDALARSYGSAAVELIARRSPGRPVTALRPRPLPRPAGEPGQLGADLRTRSLHARWGGEWDWDLTLRPPRPLPVSAGHLASARRMHRQVRRGLGVGAPVLVCCSTASAGPGAGVEEARRSDVVLSVPRVIERSARLGDDVTVRQVPGGAHDLALSGPRARAEYLGAVTTWLAHRLPPSPHEGLPLAA